MAAGVSLCLTVFLIAAFQNPIRAKQPNTEQNAHVFKGAEPVGIIGTVVAMTRETWWSAGGEIHILLIRVDRVLDKKKTENYVRADFAKHSIYSDSPESLAYEKLATAFHEKRKWKIQLHPPTDSPECYKIPPPPIDGDYLTYGNPVIQPVGGATGYPNINVVPCYGFFPADVRENQSPEQAK
jgi:hypothetical protein